MANLTVTVDDGVLRRARRKAIDQGTSVNAILSEYLRHYAGASGSTQALEAFLELADAADASSGERGRTWARDDLYDRTHVR